MDRTQEKALKKLTCEQMYVEMDINVHDISMAIGVCEQTIY